MEKKNQLINIMYNYLARTPLYLASCKLNCQVLWHVPWYPTRFLKALHNYFIPCLNLWKTYGNLGKSLEISANFLKLWKCFKHIFEELRRFLKLLENFRNNSKVFSRCFYDFLKFSENLWKCLKIFGNFLKTSETVQK